MSQGGIPPDIPRVELKLTFNDGGGNEFNTKFIEMKERLHHIQDVAGSTGTLINIPDEQLPAYEANEGQGRGPAATADAGGAGATGLAPAETLGRSASASSQNTRAPDEPPPGYEEAQAQTISMRLEDHIREEAERR